MYEATVTFPAAGRWSYAATMAPHVVPPESAFLPLNVGPASDGGSLPRVPAAVGAAVLAVLLAALVAVRRRRLPVPSRA